MTCPSLLYDFIDTHINTKRAANCKPLKLAIPKSIDHDLKVYAEYILNFEFKYLNARIEPSIIKIGIKQDKVCIRVDESLRSDRKRIKDYLVDDLDNMKELLRHLCRLNKDYERTTYFLRAQLIPGILNPTKKYLQLQYSLQEGYLAA